MNFFHETTMSVKKKKNNQKKLSKINAVFSALIQFVELKIILCNWKRFAAFVFWALLNPSSQCSTILQPQLWSYDILICLYHLQVLRLFSQTSFGFWTRSYRTRGRGSFGGTIFKKQQNNKRLCCFLGSRLIAFEYFFKTYDKKT